MSSNNLQTVAGIHLSGPNAHKTSIVIMTGALGEGNLKIYQVFEKIGGVGKLFSDDRLFEILRQFYPQETFIDCPLTEPPCVSCQRDVCPGVDACEDMAVAYMQSITNNKLKGRRRKRPINPQTQRLWDVIQWSQDGYHLQEPSYSANMAPLVVRAKTLQRRLNGLAPPIQLKETLVPIALRRMGRAVGLPYDVLIGYRAFGVGRKNRELIVERLYREGKISLNCLEQVASSHENFHAFIAALVAAYFQESRCEAPENSFMRDQGWVFLPEAEEKFS